MPHCVIPKRRTPADYHAEMTECFPEARKYFYYACQAAKHLCKSSDDNAYIANRERKVHELIDEIWMFADKKFEEDDLDAVK